MMPLTFTAVVSNSDPSVAAMLSAAVMAATLVGIAAAVIFEKLEERKDR